MTLTRPIHTALAAAALMLLATCASVDHSEAPARQDDICAVFDQRPGWRESVERAAAKWGAPVPVAMAIMWRESSFRSSVRPPKKYTLGIIPAGHISSAYGYAQAIDGTWDWYRQETGRSSASRTEFEDAADFVGWYMAKSLTSNAILMHDAYNQYLAYHEGHTGFRRGSYRAKGWLMDTARRVAAQAERYRARLPACS